MKFVDPSVAKAQLNQWGESHTPFLFFTDYAAERWYVCPLSDVDAQNVLYSVPGVTNACAETPPLPRHYRWTCTLPPFGLYAEACDHVLQEIRAGNSFLTNLTWALPLTTDLDQNAMFYGSRAKFRLSVRGLFTVFSPEPFVRIEGNNITTYPMKGTIAAQQPDAERILLNNAKEQAEHATIADLMRNDLSQIATHVRVNRYRYVEQIHSPHGNILQTSSEISGRLPVSLRHRFGDILLPLLPAGSISGAPKRKTCDIIAEAEPTPRGFYTGIFGVYDGLCLQTAVMIRFVEVCPDGSLLFHAGGGITAQSDVRAEYDEIKLKTHAPIY